MHTTPYSLHVSTYRICTYLKLLRNILSKSFFSLVFEEYYYVKQPDKFVPIINIFVVVKVLTVIAGIFLKL